MILATTYKVQKGDTLSAIARKYNTTVNALVKLNNIQNPDKIYVGQVLTISGSQTAAEKVTLSKATITALGLQTGSDRTIYATWSWSKENTDKYSVEWKYNTGDGVWFNGSSSEETSKQSTYSAPENAKSVKFRVKPIAKTKKVNDKDVYYWDAGWTEKTFSMDKIPLGQPSKPSAQVNEEGTQLTTSISDLASLKATIIQFDVAKNNTPSYKTKKISITATDSASFVCPLDPSASYKVRCRAIKNDLSGEWSQWSDAVYSKPELPSDFTITDCSIDTDINGENPVLKVKWTEVTGLVGQVTDGKIDTVTYVCEYTDKKINFTDNITDKIKSWTGQTTSCSITDVTKGQTYYVRVKYKNVADVFSGYSNIVSTSSGDKPQAPTTWSSVTSVEWGQVATLYWQHNSKDGSACTYADLEVYVEGTKVATEVFDYTNGDDVVETEVTKEYTVDTSVLVPEEGGRIEWRVRTAGVASSAGERLLGEWSVIRVLHVYAYPKLECWVSDYEGNSYAASSGERAYWVGEGDERYLVDPDPEPGEFDLHYFPIILHATADVQTSNQRALSYRIQIISNEEYETVDNFGDTSLVMEGDVVFSRIFDHIDQSKPNSFDYNITAGDVNLEPNISYNLVCEVTMNSGLSEKAYFTFLTVWEEPEYTVNAEIGIDKDSYSAIIRPYCLDDKALAPDVQMYVYRREPDGTFTEIASNVPNDGVTYVTDPHPALDYARYRIVAEDMNTDAIFYNDLPGHYVGCKSVIIQWDERWTDFDVSGASDPSWSGSLLELKYNIDVSDKNKPDVSLIEYIGREYPVSYYGTQRGTSATWNVVIDKKDKETIYALRRLSHWMGNVYVREPSGTGYWASVTVSFSQKHQDPTIPVSISINRVEGGM